MPPAADPLPLPALGLVWGVSDADRLKQAGVEYRAILQEALERLRKAVEDATASGDLPPEAAEQFPDAEIEPPQSREVNGATLYWYPLPPIWGLDKRLAVSAAVSQQFAAFSLLPQLTQRLIEEQPLAAFGPLEELDRPLASAVYFDFPALVELARPWVGYITAFAHGVAPADLESNPAAKETRDHIHALLEIAACCRGVASVTYREGDVYITRAQMRFEDLEGDD
jgi:hypothetical protein